MDEVVIKGTENNDEWEYNFSVFFNEFIGNSKFSESCTIENPEVLFFEFDAENNVLTAEAIEPLQIKNEALGYNLRYDLEYFSKEGKITEYLGYSYFKKLKGNKNKQKKWKENRLKAYNGSPIHFYRSVLKHSSKEEGFIIHQFYREKNKDRPSQKELLKARKMLTESKDGINLLKEIDEPKNSIDSALVVLKKVELPKYIDYLYKSDIAPSVIIHKEDDQIYLQFENNLMITYLKEKEEKGYILGNPSRKSHKAHPQTSNIIPQAEKIMIYPKGILANPLEFLYEHYWSYEKIAHSLPLNYEAAKAN